MATQVNRFYISEQCTAWKYDRKFLDTYAVLTHCIVVNSKIQNQFPIVGITENK
jgi:hypothetical protein